MSAHRKCCCEEWHPATECGGGATIWVPTYAECLSGGSVADRVIVTGDICYEVDGEIRTKTADLPQGADTREFSQFTCAENCDTAPCAAGYHEFSYCTRRPFRPDSIRVFVSAEDYQLWADQYACANCCKSWKIGGVCVGFPENSVSVDVPPATSIVATDPPADYPSYTSCCGCEDTCEGWDPFYGSPCDGFASPSASDCPDSAVSGQTVIANHSVSYNYSDVWEYRDFTTGDLFGGDFDDVVFNGSASGSTRVRHAAGPVTILSGGVSLSGDCDDPGGSSDRGMPFRGNLGAVFGGANIPLAHVLWFWMQTGLSFNCLELRPSFTWFNESTEFLQDPGTAGHRQTDYKMDLSWSSQNDFTCQQYAYGRTLTVTESATKRFGNSGNGQILQTQTRTSSMTAAVSGIMECTTNTQVACCKEFPTQPPPLLIGTDGLPLGEQYGKVRGALVRVFGSMGLIQRYRNSVQMPKG